MLSHSHWRVNPADWVVRSLRSVIDVSNKENKDKNHDHASFLLGIEVWNESPAHKFIMALMLLLTVVQLASSYLGAPSLTSRPRNHARGEGSATHVVTPSHLLQ